MEKEEFQYLTTHTESFPYTTKQVQTLLDNGKKEAQKPGRRFNGFTDPPK